MPGSASACTPISCRRASPSGRRHRPKTARSSCCSAWPCWCRLFSVIPHGPIGYSAARYGPGAAIIDARRAKSAPAGAAPVVVRRPLARRGRHGQHLGLWLEAVDRAEIIGDTLVQTTAILVVPVVRRGWKNNSDELNKDNFY